MFHFSSLISSSSHLSSQSGSISGILKLKATVSRYSQVHQQIIGTFSLLIKLSIMVLVSFLYSQTEYFSLISIISIIL